MTHVQCDTKPTVAVPAAGHHCPLTGYLVILLGDRGTYVRTTYPGLLLENATAGSRTRDLLSRRSKGLTTTPPDVSDI